LFRAVQELLFNVVKHAGVSSARLALSDVDGQVSISVSDQGKGFDHDRLNASDAGFGLMSIRERARYMGGSLTIDSAPGHGSRFTLVVPLGVENDYVPSQQLQSGKPKRRISDRPAASAPGGTRVLFADDHHVMRQGLINLISGQPGILVVGEAANGREALDQTRHLRPNVVVMDVSMPEMDGVEATRRIKAEWPEVRVIGLSMNEDGHVRQAMRQAGAEILLSKTASMPELLKAIYGIDREEVNL
jgi:CheY-like chemotaxis protein